MSTVYLGIGTNSGNKSANLETCFDLVNQSIGKILRRSETYLSTSWGFVSDDFYNEVWQIDTESGPQQLLKDCKKIEKEMGRESLRVRKGYRSRVIDIDILLYDQIIIATKGLTIPHPALHRRNFVLMPWAEIAPDCLVPIFELSVKELLEISEDDGYCKPLKDV